MSTLLVPRDRVVMTILLTSLLVYALLSGSVVAALIVAVMMSMRMVYLYPRAMNYMVTNDTLIDVKIKLMSEVDGRDVVLTELRSGECKTLALTSRTANLSISMLTPLSRARHIAGSGE